MAAVPFFIQSPDADRYCHQLDDQQQPPQPLRRADKSEPSSAVVEDDLPPLLELRDAPRRTLNHVDMMDCRDPVCPPPPDRQRLPTAGYRDARTSSYLDGGYYRSVSDFAGYQLSLIHI